MYIQSEIEEEIKMITTRFIYDMRSDLIKLDDYLNIKCNTDALIFTICEYFNTQMLDNEDIRKIDEILTINITDIYRNVTHVINYYNVKEIILFNVYKYMYICEFYEFYEMSFNLKKIAEMVDDL